MEIIPTSTPDPEIENAQKRVRKIKKFYKELASWAGTSIFLIALDMFLSGGITWSKYPVFFWGISLIIQFFTVLHLQKTDKNWEDKMMRKFTGKSIQPEMKDTSTPAYEDYSEELLREQPEREKEVADLSEYRKLKKPWKEEDLV